MLRSVRIKIYTFRQQIISVYIICTRLFKRRCIVPFYFTVKEIAVYSIEQYAVIVVYKRVRIITRLYYYCVLN